MDETVDDGLAFASSSVDEGLAFASSSVHPQTCARYFFMLTRFVFISTIHGWSIILQGVARRFGSFSKLARC